MPKSSLFSKPLPLILLALLIISIPSLFFILQTLKIKLSSLNHQFKSQLTLTLKQTFNSNISFESIQIHSFKSISLHHLSVPQHFRNDIPLFQSQSLIVQFDLVAILFNQKPLIRNIQNILFQNFTFYIDENFFQNPFIQAVLGKDDGINDFPIDLQVQFQNGSIQSHFIHPDYPLLNAKPLSLSIQASHQKISFQASGNIQLVHPKKTYFAHSPFFLQFDNFFDQNTLNGKIHLQSFHYLNYPFQNFAFQFNYQPHRLQFQPVPSSYFKPASNPSQLLDIHFDYSIPHRELLVQSFARTPNLPTSNIVRNFLKQSPQLSQLLPLLPNPFLPLGKSSFLFQKGQLQSFKIHIHNLFKILQNQDSLSFIVQKKIQNPMISIHKIQYTAPNSQSISGQIHFHPLPSSPKSPNQPLYQFHSARLNAQNLQLSHTLAKFLPNPPNPFPYTSKILSTPLSFQFTSKKLFDQYQSSFTQLKPFPIPSFQALYSPQNDHSFLLLKSKPQALTPFHIKLQFPNQNPTSLFTQAQFQNIPSRSFKPFLNALPQSFHSSPFLSNSFLNLSINGYFFLPNLTQSSFSSQISTSNPLAPNPKIASLNFQYQNHTLTFQNSFFSFPPLAQNPQKIHFHGSLQFAPQKLTFQNLSFVLFDYQLSLNGSISKKQIYSPLFHANLLLSSPQLPHSLSLNTQFQTSPQKLKFQKSLLSIHQKLNPNKKQFQFQGNLSFQPQLFQAQFLALPLYPSSLEKISLQFSLPSIKQIFYPKIFLTWFTHRQKPKTLALYGLFTQKNQKIYAKFASLFQKSYSQFLGQFDYSQKNPNLKLSWITPQNYFSFQAFFPPPSKTTIHSQIVLHVNRQTFHIQAAYLKKLSTLKLNLSLQQYPIAAQGTLAFKPNRILSNFQFFTPYFQNSPILWNGYFSFQHQSILIKTKINQNLSLNGQFNYSNPYSLSLKLKSLFLQTQKNTVYSDQGLSLFWSNQTFQIDGNVGLNLDFFHSSWNFQAQINYQNLSDQKQIQPFKISDLKISRNQKLLTKSAGTLHLSPKQWTLNLQEIHQKLKVKILYDPNIKIIQTDLIFQGFSLENWYYGLKGFLFGDLQIRLSSQNFDLYSSALAIKKGKYLNHSFNGYISFTKNQNQLSLSRIFLLVNGIAFNVDNMLYHYSGKILNPNRFLIEIEHMNITSQNFKFQLKKLKSHLNIGQFNFENFLEWNPNIFVSWMFFVLNNQFSLQLASAYWNGGFFKVSRLNYEWGKNWKVDFDAQLAADILGNQILVDMEVFGGQENSSGEINLKSDYFVFNQNDQKNFALYIQSDQTGWKILDNDYGIQGFFNWDNQFFRYVLNYQGNTNFKSEGQFDILSKQMDMNLKFKNNDLSNSRLMSSVFEYLAGQMEADIQIQGSWYDPDIIGFFVWRNGQLELFDEKLVLDDIDIRMSFGGSLWIYEKDGVQYNHNLKGQVKYGDGNILISGYMNINDWELSRYDIDLKTLEILDLEIKNDFLSYDGDMSGDLNLKGDGLKKILRGHLWVGEGDLQYTLGVDSDGGGFWEDLSLEGLEVFLIDNISVSINQKGFRLGEVVFTGGVSERNRVVLDKGVGRLGEVGVRGELGIDQGEFNYFGVDFRIIEGQLSLVEEGRGSKIYLRAKTNVRDESNRSVVIFLRVDDLLVRVQEIFSLEEERSINYILDHIYSSPPKNRQELSLLLGFESESDREEILGLGEKLSYWQPGQLLDLGLSLAIIKPIEKKLRELFGIDTFSIRQKFFENVLFEDYVRGEYGKEALGKVNFLKDTEVILGKYLMDDVYINLGVLLRQDLILGQEDAINEVLKLGFELDLLPIMGIEEEFWRLGGIFEYYYDVGGDMEDFGLRRGELKLMLETSLSF